MPAENLLQPTRGDGLTIAYHGLNLGRVALCANAAGTMRLMLASMIPWAKFRSTYGAADRHPRTGAAPPRPPGRPDRRPAMPWSPWCCGLIDQGYRGEMECIIAKIFGSEAQKEAAIELFMKTHGGRSFLHGHIFGDNVHEYLAPCIYEGEGEMLGMAFFKSLVKQHGKQYFEPIGKALQAAGIKKPNLAQPGPRLGPARRACAVRQMAGRRRSCGRKPRPQLPAMPDDLREHAEFAVRLPAALAAGDLAAR